MSKDSATRLDVINLQGMLDKRLLERQARETGICPVREDLYSQCFDELIRQVTLDGPERGLLTLRVRDEIKMTIDAYKILYERWGDAPPPHHPTDPNTQRSTPTLPRHPRTQQPMLS